MEAVICTRSVSSDPLTYQDGDIVDTFSISRIRIAAAQSLFNPKLFGFNASGLRDDSALMQVVDAFSAFKFERAGNNSALMTDLTTGVQELAEFEHLDEYIKRRVSSQSHLVWGTQGSEVWYTKRRDNIDHVALWDLIEQVSYHIREDYSHWPLSEIEKAFFLPVSMIGKAYQPDGTTQDVELSDPTVFARKEPVTTVDGFDPDGEPIVVQTQKRKWQVPYWDFTDTLGTDVDLIRSTKVVDARVDDDIPHIDALCVEKV